MSTDKQLDIIYDLIYHLIRNNELILLDKMIELIGGITDDLDIKLGLITASFPVKLKLSNNRLFARQFLKETLDEEILTGL